VEEDREGWWVVGLWEGGRRGQGVRLLLPKIDSAALMSGAKQDLEEGYPYRPARLVDL